MSIASLFKPVDSSKTRLPRTDVLERVAKYADGDLVISSYLDISTDELIKMLRNDLVPASRLEEVQNIVRTRLSGETTAAPKKSVGETISTKPIKDFITLEDIIGTSSTPSGFERGNYLESLIGSGTTGGAPQRGSPAKDKDYTDPLNARPDDSPARLGLEGPTPGRRPSGGMSYTPEAPEESRPKQDYFARLRSGGARPEGEASGFPVAIAPGGARPEGEASGLPAASQSQIDAYKLKPDADRVARGLESIMAENLGGSDAIKVDQVKSASKPGEDTAARSEIASMLKDPRSVENTGLLDTIKRFLGPTPVQEAVSQMQQELTDAEKAERKAQPTQRLRPPVSSTIEPPVKRGTSITELLYGRGEAQRMEEEATATAAAEAADKATTDRMNAREAGISALPSNVGAATDQSGGIVPPAFRSGSADVSGTATPTAPTVASIGGRYVPPASATSSTSSTSSQPSATPPAFRSGLDDRPSKDDKKAIQETATEVAKNPSVGGIQSLFEQAGFSDALLQLGLGMMASKNPDFLGALGESGQSAVALMAKQREEAKKAKLEADKMTLEERRVAATEADVKNRGDADKTPAAMKSSKYLADATIIAKKQKAAGQFGTAEQLYVMDQTRSDLASIAEKAGQSSSNNWQSGMNKILAMNATTKSEKAAREAALEQYYKTNGSNAEEAYNQGITRSLGRLDPEGLLSIGIAPVAAATPVDLKSTYNLQ